MPGRQRLEVNLGTTRAQSRIDLASIARCRTNEYEIGRCSLFEELFDVGGDLRIGRIIIGRLKVCSLIFQHLQELILEHLIHLADLIDEQDTAVGLGDKAGLRLGDTAVCQILLRALINGIMDGSHQDP